MQLPILADRRSYDDAAALIAVFGAQAGLEAASRADRSRDCGDEVHFCHWRQTERMVFLLQMEKTLGTLH